MSTRQIRLLLSILLFGISMCGARAAEYFVSLEGSDTNAGLSRAAAFLTIQRGVDALAPGDTLTILPGEYFGSVRRKGLGTNNVVTTIRAEISGTVVLRGDVSAPSFRKADGYRFVYVADIAVTGAVVVVNELDTLNVLEGAPNVQQLEFIPGGFYHDRDAGKLYISTPDLTSPQDHCYTLSLTGSHGLYLRNPRRVVIEGLAVTGFNTARMINRRDGTANSVFGVFMNMPRNCVIRDCKAYLNGRGIGLNSALRGDSDAGGNLIERCVGWGNQSRFASGTSGGVSIFSAKRDVIRDCAAFLNGAYGISIYGGGVASKDEKIKSRLVNVIAWGNGPADVKIKTGHDNVHTTERSVVERPSNDYDPSHCLLGTAHLRDVPTNVVNDNIVMDREKNLDPDAEFADPENRDYRLQATSRFRGTGPKGTDRGPFQYKKNIFYVRTDGDDQADGLSVSNAWKTLPRATRRLRAGDTLYIQPGIYEGDLKLKLKGREGKPVSIRGRGRKPVVVRGRIVLSDSRHVEFMRLDFDGGLSIDQAANASLRNCRFRGTNTCVQANRVNGLTLTHCEFSGFTNAAITLTDCEDVDLRGNWFDNANGVGVQIDDVDAIKYAGYNGYLNADNAWKVEATHPGSGRYNEFGSSVGPHGRSADGPYHTRLGVHTFRKKDDRVLRFTGPFIHSTGATSANIEWWASVPAQYDLSWGTGEELTNTVKRYAHKAASFSLTGLQTNTTYRFQVKPDRPLIGLSGEKAEAKPVESVSITFTTAVERAEAKVYYVATNGNDRATGLSRDQAWQTLAHAADRVRPGDTVLITGGAYVESVRLRVTGEKGRPITFKAMPGHKVTFDGMNRALDHAFLAADKDHLRFDALYFTGFDIRCSSAPFILSRARSGNGAFTLYRSDDVHITRCFQDGRGPGYSPGLVFALHCADLLVRNNVIINSMGSGVTIYWDSLRARIQNNVFLRSLISHTGLHVWTHKVKKPEDNCYLDNNIFTDNIRSKLPQSLLSNAETALTRQNCFYLRVPAEERVWGRGDIKTVADFIKYAAKKWPGRENIAADPMLRVSLDMKRTDKDGNRIYLGDAMYMVKDLDFPDLFATNPEVVKRGIGLQPEAFKDFHFNNKTTDQEPGNH